MNSLLETLDIRGKAFVDLGCAEGNYVEKISRRGASVAIGLDISNPKLLRALKKRPRALNTTARACTGFIQADMEHLPFKSQVFDIVLCVATLEHIVDYWKGLEEIHRIIKPGRLLLLEVPMCIPPFRIPLLQKGPFDKLGNGHLHFFTPNRIFREIKNAGFYVDSIYYESPSRFIFNLLLRVNPCRNTWAIKTFPHIVIIGKKRMEFHAP